MQSQVPQSIPVEHRLSCTIFASIPSSNPKSPSRLNPNCCFKTPRSFRTSRKTPSARRAGRVKCSGSSEVGDGSGDDLRTSLSGLVGDQVEELLSREDNKGLLEGLERASIRVEAAKRELAEIERQEQEAKLVRDYIARLETRACEIAECQNDISEARTMVEEAARSLSLTASQGGEEDGSFANMNEDYLIDRGRERLESVKAAFVSAIVGTLAELPISLSQASGIEQLILPLGITFMSCALFGVTFRYTIRRDLDNVQLKTGTCAAFGVVKGLAALRGGPPLELSPESFVAHAADGSVFVSQALLVFAFASIGLDFCFKARLLSPFPMTVAGGRGFE